MTNKIVLTDWPKWKYIEANYRGVKTEKLLKIRESVFHGMMCDHSEIAGGYVITYRLEAIEEELKFRNVVLRPR
jgi:hypothetical protein